MDGFKYKTMKQWFYYLSIVAVLESLFCGALLLRNYSLDFTRKVEKLEHRSMYVGAQSVHILSGYGKVGIFLRGITVQFERGSARLLCCVCGVVSENNKLV